MGMMISLSQLGKKMSNKTKLIRKEVINAN